MTAASLHPVEQRDTFDPAAWLSAFSTIGGAYVLMADRKLAFMVTDCDVEDLAIVMTHLIGRPDRHEALKAAIERRQVGEAA